MKNTSLGTKANQASRFRETRKHHSKETAEDYTEMVADLVQSRGEARTCDIAQALGISHVTAIRSIRRLTVQGYMTKSARGPITLTRKGKRTALVAKKRHELLVELFLQMGVPQDIAEVDAEGAEHHISQTTLRFLKRFLKTIRT